MKIRYTNDDQPTVTFDGYELVLRVPRYGASVVARPLDPTLLAAATKLKVMREVDDMFRAKWPWWDDLNKGKVRFVSTRRPGTPPMNK